MGKFEDLFNERAAILEFDAGLSKQEAEKQALLEVSHYFNTIGENYE